MERRRGRGDGVWRGWEIYVQITHLKAYATTIASHIEHTTIFVIFEQQSPDDATRQRQAYSAKMNRKLERQAVAAAVAVHHWIWMPSGNVCKICIRMAIVKASSNKPADFYFSVPSTCSVADVHEWHERKTSKIWSKWMGRWSSDSEIAVESSISLNFAFLERSAWQMRSPLPLGHFQRNTSR